MFAEIEPFDEYRTRLNSLKHVSFTFHFIHMELMLNTKKKSISFTSSNILDIIPIKIRGRNLALIH